jgi:hypothetical protein
MVERMREIREQVSHEIMNLSLKQEKAYIFDALKKLKAERKKKDR